MLQCQSHPSISWQPGKRLWYVWLSSDFAIGLFHNPERESIFSRSHLSGGWNDDCMWKWSWPHLYIFCWNHHVLTENQTWIFQVACSSTVCTFFFVFWPFHLIINYQGSLTREQYLIASGTNDKMPDINVWEKQVGIYIFKCILKWFSKRKGYIEQGRSCNLFVVSILVLIGLNILVLSGLFFASSNFHQGFLNTLTGVTSGDQSHTWETRGVRSTEHEHDPMVQLQEGRYPL